MGSDTTVCDNGRPPCRVYLWSQLSFLSIFVSFNWASVDLQGTIKGWFSHESVFLRKRTMDYISLGELQNIVSFIFPFHDLNLTSFHMKYKSLTSWGMERI